MRDSLKKFALPVLILITWNFKSQNLKGTLRDNNSYKPVPHATITAQSSASYNTVTDSLGKFALNVQPGIYNLLIVHPGFKSEMRTNILVGTKQHHENISLKFYSDTLEEIVITPNEETEEITETKMHQYAASFYDPARLINSNAAAINTNDQANHFSVRGASPNFIQWKVEDVEVVNPNHLENAGTLNDRPTSNGGGVSMISAQLLSRSPFMLPVFKPVYGNALTGSFNIQLRNGNDEKAEHIVQASFLGIDFATEGPLEKNKSSYLVNARYSTIGLLSEMGVDFGGEKTNYKDLSATINFKTKNGAFKFFTITGASSNIFRGAADTANAETEKDFMNITYKSLTAINGASFITSIGSRGFFKTVAAFSIKQNDYGREPVLMRDVLTSTDEKYETRRGSLLITGGKNFNRLHLSAGSYVNYFSNTLSVSQDSISFSNSMDQPFAQPFLNAEFNLKKLMISGGLHSIYQFHNSLFVPLPTLKLQYALTEKNLVTLAYAKQAQVQNLLFYTVQNTRQLPPAEMDILSGSYKYSGTILTAGIEMYHQLYSKLPANADHGFNAINYFNEQILFPLHPTGTATITGLDVNIKLNYMNYYIIGSATFLQSFYPVHGKDERTRFDPGENYFVTAGKEWRLKESKFLSVDVRSNYRKGFRQAAPTQIENSSFIYSGNLPDYFRSDIRISYRKSKTKSTRIWALDIQNVTGKRNVGYYYYDRLTKKTEALYQLGLIPVLSYKLFF